MNIPDTRIPTRLPTHALLRIAITLPLLMAVLTFAASAHAADTAKEPAVEADHVALLRGHLKTKNGDGIRVELQAIADVYATTESKVVRGHMLSAVAKVLRMKNETLQSAALDAFEDMEDPAAWKHYGKLLKKPFKNEFPRLASQAMDVTRALKPEQAIKPLLRIVKKSKNLAAAAKAVDTLGAYKQSRQRTRILGELIAATLKERPGVRGRDNTVVYGPRQTGEQARSRWHALVRPMVDAANELTGQDYGSAEDWFDVWRTHKRKPAELFQDDA